MHPAARRMRICLVVCCVGGSSTFVHADDPAAPSEASGLRDPVAANELPDVDRGIAFFSKRVRQNDRDFISRTILGRLYVRKARETDDGAFYHLAEQAFRKVLKLRPDDPEALLGLASVEMAHHEFAEALLLAEQVRKDHPHDRTALAAIGDAQLQLGRYDEAGATYAALAEKVKTAPVQARLADLAELHGRPQQAVELLRQAWQQARTARATGPEQAWYVQRMGEIELQQGQLESAREHFELVRKLQPGHQHALEFLAHLTAREGDYDTAEQLYWQAMAGGGHPDLYAAVGDVWTARGENAKADQYYQRAIHLWEHTGDDDAQHALPGEPPLPDGSPRSMAPHSHEHADAHSRTLSLFLSDHALQPMRAFQLAQQNLKIRQDIESYDALAWALYRNQQFDEAAAASERALSYRTRRADLHFHAGMIDAARGQTQSAREHLTTALEINPRFSVLHATTAQKKLEALRRSDQ